MTELYPLKLRGIPVTCSGRQPAARQIQKAGCHLHTTRPVSRSARIVNITNGAYTGLPSRIFSVRPEGCLEDYEGGRFPL